jgi:acyl-CoA synthetase (AMP-forming)/AMP-acid ligase II
MLGLMMDRPLLTSGVLRHAELIHGDQEVVCRRGGRSTTTTFAELARRSRLLASALAACGIRPGDRVGTLAWNTTSHVEMLFAATGIGAVFHPINPHLGIEELRYVLRHADHALVFFDGELRDLVDDLRPALTTDRWITMGQTGRGASAFLTFDELLALGDRRFEWPEFDERLAATLCYTPGTTGRSRGVLSSHRSMVLHSLATLGPNSFPVSVSDAVLTTVPISHVNGWGFPVTALMAGARLLLAGGDADPGSVVDFLNGERATVGVGWPRLWEQVLEYLRLSAGRLPTVRRLFCGGSAAPASLIEAFEIEYGIDVTQGWGMTETGPIATASTVEMKGKQGKPLFGVDVRIVDAAGADLPWDGVTNGELVVRGPWVASAYYGETPGSGTGWNWFATGDIARIDPDGSVTITDRLGDVIKSGGEWIISLDLEKAAMDHPAIRQAAAIAVPDPHWGERPLLVATTWREPPPAVDDVIAHMAELVPRWWLPDHVAFVRELPAGPTGKIVKWRLRESFGAVPATVCQSLRTSTWGIDGDAIGSCPPDPG